ncbi:GNAT family N-acetyltransferase [Nocardia sp. CDC160]|uniref:GNAT family N-acetyltransferase n=1 Tax=Nocardia sp. CDC160 TaxID=3112166 RepID=UPI002DBA759F|nr:GNAT family N-acetyltransferase [Nocardia sp. CDC160]MEC3916518.1 GNAT family N-acetyltransferase [Nocardia sp. CDC160]
MIRRATPADIPALVQLVHDLAEYEKAPDECTLTETQLETALFGPNPALYAHVAENDRGIVGCAIWFLNFSTWKGVHGIYLEDLYVKPEARGAGLGKSLLATLAREAVERGYARVDWAVLTWNTPSIDFYESIGAEHQHEWTGYRLSGGPLERLAAHADD